MPSCHHSTLPFTPLKFTFTSKSAKVSKSAIARMSYFVFCTSGIKSGIIAGIPSYLNTLQGWLSTAGQKDKYWVPCYRAITDGWSDDVFHQKCDDRGPSITIVRFNANSIVGGFSDRNWRKGEFLFQYCHTNGKRKLEY